MSTVHIHLNDQQETRLQQIIAKTDWKRTQVFLTALKEMHERMFPGGETKPPQQTTTT